MGARSKPIGGERGRQSSRQIFLRHEAVDADFPLAPSRRRLRARAEGFVRRADVAREGRAGPSALRALPDPRHAGASEGRRRRQDQQERPAVTPDLSHQAPGVTIFKCPHCQSEYELIMSHVSYRQRSYCKCQVCWKTMYSWDSSRVPRFTLLNRPDSTLNRA
jgi:hypothetical protein